MKNTSTDQVVVFYSTVILFIKHMALILRARYFFFLTESSLGIHASVFFCSLACVSKNDIDHVSQRCSNISTRCRSVMDSMAILITSMIFHLNEQIGKTSTLKECKLHKNNRLVFSRDIHLHQCNVKFTTINKLGRLPQ